MAEERFLGDMVKEICAQKKSGALYVDIVETSEDMFKIYFEKGTIYHIRYGSAIGNDCLEILEYYNLYSATFFEGITAPGTPAKDLPSTEVIISKFASLQKKVKVR
jgi:hypothetical protein